MKLTVAKLREFLALYNNEHSKKFLNWFFGYQWPIHNIFNELDGNDNKMAVIDYVREFFKNRINPQSASFTVLTKCFELDGASAALWYDTFIYLESQNLVTEEVYDKVIQYPHPAELIKYIADLQYYQLLNKSRLETALKNPNNIRIITNCFAMLNSIPTQFMSETLDYAEKHAEPEAFCKGVQLISKFLDLDRLKELNASPNIKDLNRAMEESLAKVQLLTLPFFQMIVRSRQPRYFADLILIFKSKELIDLLFDHAQYFEAINDLRALWTIVNGMEKQGLLNRDNMAELMDIKWINTPEASEVIGKHQNFVWDDDLFSKFMIAANKQNAAEKVAKFYSDNPEWFDNDDDNEDGLEMTMIRLESSH